MYNENLIQIGQYEKLFALSNINLIGSNMMHIMCIFLLKTPKLHQFYLRIVKIQL